MTQFICSVCKSSMSIKIRYKRIQGGLVPVAHVKPCQTCINKEDKVIKKEVKN